MRFALFLVASILAAAAGLPVNEETKDVDIDVATRNNVLEELVLALIEQLRDLLINGSGDIPPLDPLTIGQARLDLDAIGIENSHIEVRDATVRQHSTFVIDNLSLTMTNIILQRYTLVIDGYIPVLELEAGNYDLDVSVLGVNVYGNGETKIQIIEPRIRATIVIGPRITIQGVFFNIFNSNVGFTLSGFESHFTGLFGGDQFLNDFVSAFLRNLVPDMVQFFEAEITEVLSTLVQDIGNQILADLDLGGIIGASNMEELFDMPAMEAAANAEPQRVI